MRPIERIERVTDEHLGFIVNHGDKHITTASFAYFAANNAGDVLLECRGVHGGLVAVSFASADGERSITVVHKDYRGRGIATTLMLAKKASVPGLKSHVAATNTASMRLAAKVYGASEVQEDGRVVFFDNGHKRVGVQNA